MNYGRNPEAGRLQPVAGPAGWAGVTEVTLPGGKSPGLRPGDQELVPPGPSI